MFTYSFYSKVTVKLQREEIHKEDNSLEYIKMCSLIYQSWICISGWKLSSSSSHNPSAFRSTSCSKENQLGGKHSH